MQTRKVRSRVDRRRRGATGAPSERLERRLLLAQAAPQLLLEEEHAHHHEQVTAELLEGGGEVAAPGAATPVTAAAGPNLRINNALVVDGNNSPIPAPLIGQRVYIRAEYTLTDLTPGQQYVVRFWVDGVPLDSSTITAQSGTRDWTWYRGGWFASPGAHSVEVTVDGNNSVAEVDETDNTFTFGFTPVAPASLPQKFFFPLRGVQSKDFRFSNYLDVDPRSGIEIDFAGGPFKYDGHAGYDIAPANFANMDASVSIHALAAGTVTATQDGYFDRETSRNSNPANYVNVDHGNGWRSIYYHFSTNTIVVRVGDVVTQGQLLGLLGSSGDSTGAHLHLGIFHNNAAIETYYDPHAYWLDPLPYQPLSEPDVMDSGTTNFAPTTPDIRERPSDVEVYPVHAGWSVHFWNKFSHLEPSDVTTMRWFRPNGTLHSSSNYSPAQISRGPTLWWTLGYGSYSPYPGEWQAVLLINGVERVRKSFTVTTGPGEPEIKLYQGDTYVLDGRTTAIDFGAAALAAAAPSRTFTVQNHGASALSLSDLVLPPGFSLASTFPSSVSPGGTASFTLSLDTHRAGVKFGQVAFSSNDADEGLFTFNVSGTVTGSAPAGAPLVTLPRPAVPFSPGRSPQLLDPGALISDSDSTHFAGGQLIVEMAGVTDADDRLGIRNQGTAAGQVSTSGSQVFYGGAAIGTFSGGEGASPLLVMLNGSATVAATQALLRNVTYGSVAAFPPVVRRYVRVTLIDDLGKVSNQPVKTVSFDTISPAAVPFAWMSGSRLNVRFDDATPITLASTAAGEEVARGAQTLAFTGVSEIVVYGTPGNDVLRISNLARAVTLSNGGGGGSDNVQVLSGTYAFSSDLSPTSRSVALTVAAGAAAVFNTSQHLASLTLHGHATVAAGADKTVVTNALSIPAGGLFDLKDNDLIVDYAAVSPLGTWNGSAYDGVSGLLSSGRITSSAANGTYTTLGVAEARDALGVTGFSTAIWSGRTVDASAVLVKFTYGGDANLDGAIDIDDYGQIDFNVGLSGAVLGYFNGDFNLDGQINIDDYGIIDFNVGIQGPPLAPASGVRPSGSGVAEGSGERVPLKASAIPNAPPAPPAAQAPEPPGWAAATPPPHHHVLLLGEHDELRALTAELLR